MSHFTSITTQIRDINSLRAACMELQFTVETDAVARGSGSQQNGEYVIRLKGACDIAVNRQTDGTYALEADQWGGHVEREVGPKFGRLLQLYAAHNAAYEACKRGLRVHRSTLNDGTIKLVIGGIPA